MSATSSQSSEVRVSAAAGNGDPTGDAGQLLDGSGERGSEIGHGTSLLAIALIALATVLSFWPVLRCDFTLRDDDHNVWQNADLTPPTPQGLLRYWTRPFWGLYAPVTHTVWWCLAHISERSALPGQAPLTPVTYHGANLVFHVAAAVVAFLILRRLFRHVWAACVAALFFALHPVQVDSVAWVSGLKDVLATMFALAALWQYLLSSDESLEASDRKFHFALALIAMVAAALSKVSATMLPFSIFAIECLLLRRPWRQAARRVLPLLLVCLPMMVLGRFAQNPPSVSEIWQRPPLVLFTLSFYAMKIVWPVALAPDYGMSPQIALKVSWIWACWIIPLFVTIGVWLARRRRPELPAGALVFVISIFPVIGLFTFLYQSDSTVADHYLYFALFGVALAIAGTFARLVNARAPWIAAAVVLCALGVLTFRQTTHWTNTITLFTHNARVTPNNWRPEHAIGLALLQQKKPREAEVHLRKSIDITKTHLNVARLGVARLEQRDTNSAIEFLNEAVALDPDNSLYHLTLADAYLRANRAADARVAASRALELKPTDEIAKRVLAEAEKRVRSN